MGSHHKELFDKDEIAELHTAVQTARLSRTALMDRVDPGFVAGIPIGETPAEQLLLDLNAMNRAPVRAGGTSPFQTWLATAVLLVKAVEIVGVFKRFLDKLTAATSDAAKSGDTDPDAGEPPPASARPSLDGDLAALEARVEETLRGAPDLLVALAGALGVATGCEGMTRLVACAAVHAKASLVATVLDDLHAVHLAHRRVIEDLLSEILPFATDWRHLLVEARKAVARGQNAIVLPLRTETIAAIVHAGIDGRRVRFDEGAAMPDGAGRVKFPAAALAPLFQGDGSRVVEAVVMHLGAEGEPGREDLAHLKRRFPSYRDFKVVVDRWLRARGRKGAPDRLTHYLLLIDADLGEGVQKDVGTLWALACDAFARELPSLRLSRLSGDEDDLGDEYEIALHIQAVRDRR